MNITIVAGARPNFMKIAPIIDAIKTKKEQGFDVHFRLVHTGQHYDKNLSDTFFEELNIPFPDTNLEVKSGSQAEQTAGIMVGFEKELEQNPCDLVMVVGDVMIDSYLWGNIERISPEAPVPVVDVLKREKRLGGAANVAKNIKALGAECIICTIVGDDIDGEDFFNLLSNCKKQVAIV